MAEYELTRAARRDLADISDYIAQDSADAALRILLRFERTFLLLAENPGVGHRRPDLSAEAVRFLAVHSYLVVYAEGRTPLLVLRVLSGYRDVASILRFRIPAPPSPGTPSASALACCIFGRPSDGIPIPRRFHLDGDPIDRPAPRPAEPPREDVSTSLLQVNPVQHPLA